MAKQLRIDFGAAPESYKDCTSDDKALLGAILQGHWRLVQEYSNKKGVTRKGAARALKSLEQVPRHTKPFDNGPRVYIEIAIEDLKRIIADESLP